MLPWSAELAGRIDEHVITSELLRGNPLGDPHERPLWVYTPPGYDDEPVRRYPSVYVIQGYTGHLAMWRNRSPFRQPFTETADAMFARGEAPPAVVVYVDAWTAYGGSQFVDSRGTGRYHSYLCDEVVPWVDARYRTLRRPGAPGDRGQVQRRVRRDDHPDAAPRPVRRAGYARRRHAVRVLLHARVRPTAVRHLREYDGDIWRWWDDFRSRVAVHQAGRRDPARAARRGGLLLRRARTARPSCRSTRAPA